MLLASHLTWLASRFMCRVLDLQALLPLLFPFTSRIRREQGITSIIIFILSSWPESV